MSYSSLALLQSDTYFLRRAAACAAQEHVSGDPFEWAVENSWTLAAMPGFSEAYESAVASGVPNPGDDPSVITDPQILSAVQSITTA